MTLEGFVEYLERRDDSPYVNEALVLVRRYRTHDHLEDVDLGDVPTCRACGLVLERAGDALVVPCDHRWVADLANPDLAEICEACGVFRHDVE